MKEVKLDPNINIFYEKGRKYVRRNMWNCISCEEALAKEREESEQLSGITGNGRSEVAQEEYLLRKRFCSVLDGV